MGVLMIAAIAAMAHSVIAGFSDVEVSTDNRMKAANNQMNLVLSGGPIAVEGAWPSCWKSEEFTLINAGTLDGTARIHITNLECYEDAPGAGVATSEPELVAEEGGWMDILIPEPIPGNTPQENLAAGCALGVDTCNIADYIDVRIWFDENGDGIFEPTELKVQGNLSALACNWYELGFVPAPPQIDGGWGTYFEYTIDSATAVDPLALPLIANKNICVGEVLVWNDDQHLYVKYGPTSDDFALADTQVYAGTVTPPKVGWGQFPYTEDGLGGVHEYLYTIPLSDGIVIGYDGKGKLTYDYGGVSAGDTVYIAAHAQDTDGDTGWARGELRQLKIELHFPDIPCLDYSGDPIFAHWPTNAYQGDYCIFDIEFELWAP